MPKKIWMMAIAVWLQASLATLFAADSGAHFGVFSWGEGIGPDSLPQGEVIALQQTRDGYLWLGTLGGLVRFDGVRFTVFNEDNTPGLNDLEIVHLFEDSRSNLWIGTRNNGVEYISNGELKNLGIGKGSREGRLISTCEDALGAVWFYTADGQLARFYQKKVDVWRLNSGPSRCRSMIAEDSGLVWVGTDRGIYGIDPRTEFGTNSSLAKTVLQVPEGLDFLLARRNGGYWRLSGGHIQTWSGNKIQKDWGAYPWNKPVFSACEDLDGNLIVGTLGNGLWWLDAAGHSTHISSAEGLSHEYILSLTMDRDGILWVGTDGGGLDRVKRQAFSVVPKTGGLAVQSSCEDAEGGIWYNSHGGAGRWKNDVLEEYGAAQGLYNPNGQVIFVDKAQNIWAAASGSGSGGMAGSGLFQFAGGRFVPSSGWDTLPSQEISVIFQDHQGRMWIGTANGLAGWAGTTRKNYTTRDGLSSDAIQAIAEDAEGNLWIGTGNGLNELSNGQFKIFHKADGLPGDAISALNLDADGVLWIGTRGRGLGRYSKGKWTQYSTAQGLLSPSVNYLVEDGQGGLWVGSPSGPMRLRKNELNDFANGLTNAFSCRAYGKTDGLLAGECTSGSQPAACLGRDGRMWFPTIKGLASVDPKKIRLDTNPPPVVIESVFIDNQLQNTNALSVQLPSLLDVPHDKESIEIRYTSLNLGTAKTAQFKYRLEVDGHETPWTRVGDVRSADYPKLAPGHYRFHVTAANEDGVWNETGASLAIFVEPPFWRTWWFLGVTTAVLLIIIVAVVSSISTQRLQRQLEGMRQEQALEKERARIARDIHDQLGASMTQVSLLGEMVESDKDDPAEVEAHAKQISQTARDTSRVLDEIVWTVNPSNDTLDGLINYICKYAQEYLAVANIRYRLEVPADLPHTEISPELRHNVFLTAKEAVTNVVKHARATEVRLRLRLEPQRFILEIQDNGRGPINLEGKQSRNGLRNMNKRMQDVGGSFELTAVPEGGALARLTVALSSK